MNIPQFTKKLFIMMSCSLLIPISSWATTYTFIGGTANNVWTNSNNWAAGQYPGLEVQSGDLVIINNVNCFIDDFVTIHGSLANQGTIQLLKSPPFFGKLTIYGSLTNRVGSQLQVKYFPLIVKPGGAVSNDGLITVTSDELSITEMQIEGDFANESDGTVQMSNGDLLVTGSFNNYGILDINDTNFDQFNITEVRVEGIFNNKPGGQFLLDDCRVNFESSSTFTNDGTFDFDDSNNLQWLDIKGSFENGGTVNNYGKLDFETSSSTILNSGTINNLSTGDIDILRSLINTGIINNNRNFDCLNSSSTFQNGGTFNNQSTGETSIRGNFTNTGDLNNENEFVFKNSSNSNNISNINNTGSIIIESTAHLVNSGNFDNSSTGTFEIHGSCTNNSIQANTGLLQITSNGSYTNHANFNNWSAGTFTNQGTFINLNTHLNNGNITITGTYAGDGTINGALNDFDGTLSPGMSPGKIDLTGNLALQTTATYKAEIAGNGLAGEPSGFDQVNTGLATLGGTLEIILLDGFIPNPNDEYIILTSTAALNDSFNNIILPAGHAFTVNYNTNDVTIKYQGILVLPVELLSFTGRQVNEQVELNWQTASEINNLGFEIQRMNPDKTWSIIDFVEGNGTTGSVQTYTYLDREPSNGHNYYRLKQMDYNGTFEFSKILDVRLHKHVNIQVYPNPTNHSIWLSGLNDSLQSVEVWTLDGKRVIKQQMNNDQNELVLGQLPKGQYLIRLHVDQEEVTKKVLIIDE